MYKSYFLYIVLGGVFWSGTTVLRGQESMDLNTYLDYVKAYHPLVKQAQLKLSESQAKLLKSQGAFDPKLEVDYKDKTFQSTPYFERLNATFKIPTPYGLEFQGGFQEADGSYLNPEQAVSGDQLYKVGAQIDLGKGLWANERRTALKQAKSYTKQAAEENALQVNATLEAASHAFLEWYRAHQEYEVFDRFVTNAAFRFEGVKSRHRSGDLAVIDTVEARIAYNQRVLGRKKAQMKLREKALKASNFLWIGENAVEIKDEVSPQFDPLEFRQNFQPLNGSIEDHPKIKALGYKQEQLVFEKRLQRNNLLPEITVGYQWLSEINPTQQLNWAIDPDNSSTQFKLSLPLFLRKERANFKLARIQLQDIELERKQVETLLSNKIQALANQTLLLEEQWNIAQRMVLDYQALFSGEQQKFEAGESSLFLVNARESKLIEGLLKAIELNTQQQKAQASYYFQLVFPDTNPAL